MNNNVISIDLAKNVFQVCLFNSHRKPKTNIKVKRAKLLDTVRNLDANVVVMEACYSSNYWGREFQDMGYTVKLIPPHQVKPFVVGNKNDHNDAIAIGEAYYRPKATFCLVKSLDQQDIQCLYRIRERHIKSRTAISNQLRGFLAEYGIIIEKRISAIRNEVPFILEDASNKLTAMARTFISGLYEELTAHDRAIKTKEEQVETLLAPMDEYRRIQEVPGIGPITGSVLVSTVGNAAQFKNGRQMAAWIGLTPKQYASGDSSRLGGISKRGNNTLRRLLIHGARSIVQYAERKGDAFSRWIQLLLSKKQKCKVVVAVANKIARMAWAVLAKNEHYKPAELLLAA